MKAYKLEILIIDFNEVGLDDIKEIIENANYPNDCININVMDIVSVDIGEWHDEHPLNNYKTAEAEYNRLFKK